MALKNQNEPRPSAAPKRSFLAPNITRTGRLFRLAWAVGLAVAGVWLLRSVLWLAVGLFILAAFAVFEALRGWCVMRACGIKTRF